MTNFFAKDFWGAKKFQSILVHFPGIVMTGVQQTFQNKKCPNYCRQIIEYVQRTVRQITKPQ
jgi:hypothetical protein